MQIIRWPEREGAKLYSALVIERTCTFGVCVHALAGTRVTVILKNSDYTSDISIQEGSIGRVRIPVKITNRLDNAKHGLRQNYFDVGAPTMAMTEVPISM